MMEEVRGPGTEWAGEKTHTLRSDKPKFIQKSISVITTKLLNEALRSPLPTLYVVPDFRAGGSPQQTQIG